MMIAVEKCTEFDHAIDDPSLSDSNVDYMHMHSSKRRGPFSSCTRLSLMETVLFEFVL